MKTQTYYNFLHGKINIAPESGFIISSEDVSRTLYLREAETEVKTPTLFDLIDNEIKAS